MERVFILVLFGLVSLCKATSPVFPVVDPIQCNTTESEVHVALDLINEDRRQGFIFKPLRVVEAYEQHVQSHKYPASTIYYLTIDVLETKCSVLSGKPWEECEEPSSFHEWVFGECKAIILISLPWRVQKLISYNCTITSAHPRFIVRRCPDCPIAYKEITPTITESANTLIAKYNKDSNDTRYFKIYYIERVRSQWVFGHSEFFEFTIKETDCMKTQENVVLSNCKFLDDREAHVGFCSGSIIERTEGKHVSCDIYEPKDDSSHHPDYHGPYASHPERGVNLPEGQEKPEAAVQEKSQDKSQKRRHHPKHRSHCSHKGHKHGRHHHHPHHHDHPPHHRHHHHHPNHTSSEHHGHYHHHKNHTSSEHHGSSSEENTDKKGGKKADRKSFRRRSKGVVQKITLGSDTDVLPAPTITISRPTFRTEYIQFPEATSHLPTCPWTIQENAEIVPFLPHEK